MTERPLDRKPVDVAIETSAAFVFADGRVEETTVTQIVRVDRLTYDQALMIVRNPEGYSDEHRVEAALEIACRESEPDENLSLAFALL